MAKIEINQDNLIKIIANKTWLKVSVITDIIKLLDEGNTVPFIARYRKEVTEWATDEQLRDFHDIYTYTQNLENRKLDIIRLIDEKWLLTDELRASIMSCDTLARLEDIYRPFKEKKQTKATMAKAKGLEPLAIELLTGKYSQEEFDKLADTYIIDTGDKLTTVKDRKDAISWAKDIIAEMVSDHANLRDQVRQYILSTSLLITKATKTFDPNGVYKIYGDYNKKFADIPSYAYLAVNRAEEEKQISINIWYNEEYIYDQAAKIYIQPSFASSVIYISEAIKDGLDRLLMPSIIREIRSDKKQWADEAAIKVFGENMKQLLLTPPIRGLTVMWFDPGYRTGCKIAIVDPTGKFIHKDVVYISLPDKNHDADTAKMLSMISKFEIDLVVIGNGTGSRESSKYIWELIKSNNLNCKYIVVSEAGASVYSASKLAQSEYPDLDVTIRGAISIAHRAQDALAELTKIDPKAIGVWQYQHDVDQKLLATKLDEKVQDTVNAVGVNVNTASWTLLKYIAWLSETMAKNIVAYRDENGPFTSKVQLKKAKWLWPKAYEQCVWFLRIVDGKEPLDATGIHPDNYKQTYDILTNEFGVIIDKKNSLTLPVAADFTNAKIDYISSKYDIWNSTLIDIFAELKAPWLDPRTELSGPDFDSNILELSDLKVWDVVKWVVRNITDFGVFVDIWLHNDGFVHKSQLADRYVQHPIDVVSIGQNITAKVIEIDLEREKVSLNSKIFFTADKNTNKSTRPAQNNTRNNQSNRPQSSYKKPEVSTPQSNTMKWNISWS
jgi:protein Tex